MSQVLGSVAGPLTSMFGGSSTQSGDASAVAAQDAMGPYRSGLASMVNGLITNPSSIQSFPGYQFGMSQGTQAVQGSAAAKGQLNSGNTLSALNTFGQGYAQSNWLNDINSISNIAQGNPAYAGILQQGNNANTAGQVSALGGGMGALSSMFGGGSSGGGSWFSSLFSGGSGTANLSDGGDYSSFFTNYGGT